MTFTFELLRPDDLLTLTVETQNLRLDVTDPNNPVLVVDQSSQPAYLVITFAPQNIAEQAFFETGNITAQPPYNKVPPGTPPLPTTDDTLLPAGEIGARISGPSRLVFQLPKNSKIPFQLASLLDWSKLTLVVSPVAQGEPLPTPIPQPTALQTSIELPYRLMLSPSTKVGWVNAKVPITHAGRTELWHTRLARIVNVAGKSGVTQQLQEASLARPIPLRAIWSPDFVDHGELPSHNLDKTPFLSSLAPRDRAQIVILTSGTTGYFVIQAGGGTTSWTPLPIQASRLFLSALGGWLSSRGDWPQLPAYRIPIRRFPVIAAQQLGSRKVAAKTSAAKKAAVKKSAKSAIASTPIILPFETVQLDLTEWNHLATEGRDHYVKVVYEGYLYPFGHAASLVKVTERKFVPAEDVPPNGSNPSSVTAYMRQHMYIVVREIEKSYTPDLYLHQGREMPFLKDITIKTVVTPDIDEPPELGDPGYFSDNSFWINVGGQAFQFHMAAVDLTGATIDFLAPMIFVSLSETDVGTPTPGVSDASSVQVNYLNAGNARLCDVHSKKIAYADPNAGDTILKTSGLLFDAQILSSSYDGDVPFIPVLSSANVIVPSIEEILGISTAISIAYYPAYLTNGMDSNAGVFAEIDTGPDSLAVPPPVVFSANKAGGFATPSFYISGLSARKGMVAGSLDNAAAGVINPADFFGGLNISAQLFGTIPLGNLIPIDAVTKTAPANKNAPEIRSQSLPNHTNPTQVVTKVKWEPDLTDYSVGPVEIVFNQFGQNSKLTLNATITRPLDGSPSQSTVTGKLSNFEVTLLGVVGLAMNSIEFTSKNGSKTNVSVKLGGSKPIQFIGPLHFVQTLADILPSGIFGGDGPSIDLTSTGIKVSYTLGLPPISIGIFSLENIAITTGLDLPYLSGQPGFEFAFCSRGSPFLLTVECLGGGGFVHLVLTTNGIQMVEGALEFGGEFSIDLGVASGGVHIMAGIYFKLAGSNSTLTGFVDIGGEVSVLGIISISIDLNLSLSWIHTAKGDKVQGRATLSISVSILFFSISVSVSVERSFGSGSGDPGIADVMTAADWNQYCLAFAG
ncbi:MAG TPA: hypothetical protein VGU25_17455 [Acidobacteriaceae bacterium]|nr:hypothetical protein [Acidobacteriaceae bacterium]